MAEIVVVTVLQALAASAELGSALRRRILSDHQQSLVDGVNDKIDRIKSDLECIHSILRFADREAVSDPLLGDWVEKVRDVSYKVEDVLDNHMYDMSDRGERGGVFDVITRYRHKLRMLATYRRTAAQLDRIQPRMQQIMETYSRLVEKALGPLLQSDSASSSSRQQQHTISTHTMFREDSVFYSLTERGTTQKDLVQGWIISEPPEYTNVSSSSWDPRWMAIAIWGMGGLGKTTLVRDIYRNPELRKQFDCFAWVTVSRTYKIADLLQNMLMELEMDARHGDTLKNLQVNPKFADVNMMNEEQLILRIHELLHQKRYLIVLDDIWQEDVWSRIEHLFRKDHDRRSRILVTTRYEKVAMSLARNDRIMLLAPLDEADAWHLFCMKAFWQDVERKCPGNLEVSARRIVEQCGGLPLAILVAAGMMSTKGKDALVWEKSCITIGSNLAKSPELSILMHSYYDMPSCLKQCFIYCSVFPEDYIFVKNTIIRLWVAEGFIERDLSMTLEEVAEVYLEELIQRSMIQVDEQVETGEVSYIRIHDVLRMIALKISTEHKSYIIVHEEQNFSDARRLSVLADKKQIDSPLLRSLFCFSSADQLSLFKFKLLRVLLLNGCAIKNSPEEVFDLFNLRYLDIDTGMEIDQFPKKVERLQHLQSLVFWDTKVKRPPRSIIKLKNLRHLILNVIFNAGNIQGFQAPTGIWDLNNLQTLRTVEASKDLVEHIGKLTNLRTLWMSDVKHTHEEALCKSLKTMGHLQELMLTVQHGDLLNLDCLESPPPHLQSLAVYGRLASIPASHPSSSNLRRLYLFHSKLQDCVFLDILSKLPNLTALDLTDAYEGRTLNFAPNCFPSLKVLYVENLARLSSIMISKTALPSLCKLDIRSCRFLTKPSPQIENLNRLEELSLQDLSEEVTQDLKEKCSRSNNVRLILTE